MKRLVREGKTDVNKTSNSGVTPLFVASEKGHLKIVKFLVEEGEADVDQVDRLIIMDLLLSTLRH